MKRTAVPGPPRTSQASPSGCPGPVVVLQPAGPVKPRLEHHQSGGWDIDHCDIAAMLLQHTGKSRRHRPGENAGQWDIGSEFRIHAESCNPLQRPSNKAPYSRRRAEVCTLSTASASPTTSVSSTALTSSAALHSKSWRRREKKVPKFNACPRSLNLCCAVHSVFCNLYSAEYRVSSDDMDGE